MRYPSGGYQQVMSQILGETYRLESCFKSAQEEKLFPFILLDSLTGALQIRLIKTMIYKRKGTQILFDVKFSWDKRNFLEKK